MTGQYDTRLFPTNYCSCISWRFMRKPAYDRKCKHIRALENNIDQFSHCWKNLHTSNMCTDQTRSPGLYVDETSARKNNSKVHDSTWAKKRIKPKIMLYSDNYKLIKPLWLASEKRDGVRGRWTGTEMLSRGGLVIDIPDRIRSYLPINIILDGEFATARRNSLQTAIDATQSRKFSKYWKTVHFYVFDVWNHKPFVERYQLIREFPYFCKQTPIELNQITHKLTSICGKGGEGLVIRDPNAFYDTNARSKNVVKVKPTYQTQADYMGNNIFQEINTDVRFKMQMKSTLNRGTRVCFRYKDRTARGKPKYPKLCKLD
jgi:hypothetical protein